MPLRETLARRWDALALAWWIRRHRLQQARGAKAGAGEADAATVVRSPQNWLRRPRVLWVCPHPIFPMIHGSAVRQVNLIRQLARHCDLYFFVYIGGTDDPALRRELSAYGVRVFLQHSPRALDHELGVPMGARPFDFAAARERLAAIADAHDIDLIQLEHAELGGLSRIDPAAFGGFRPKIILTEHDISYRSYARRGRLNFAERFTGSESASKAECRRLERYEIEACRRVDQIHVMSAEDSDYLASSLEDGAGRIRVLPNGVDTEFYRPDPDLPRRDLLFVGSFPHLPNLDALDHFLAEIWPEVRRRVPEARLTLVGARPPERVLALDGQDGLTVLGEVEDLRTIYPRHRALIVPLRAGSGTRLKILEAFANGLPILSTPLGAEGIDAVPGEHLLIAREVEEWVDAVARILSDDALAERLGNAGRQLAEERYDWRPLGSRMLAAYAEVLGDFDEDSSPERSQPDPMESSEARISVLIAVGETSDERLLDVLDSLRQQGVEDAFEVIVVASGRLDPALRERLLERQDLRVVTASDVSGDLQAALNHAATAACGEVLVSLAANAVPQGESWLAQLTAPLFEESPPSVVQGAVWRTFGPRSTWRHESRFTAESRRWRHRFGEAPFSLANVALRRETWDKFPFPRGPLGELSWQRQLVTSKHLILPILSAGVELEDRTSIADLAVRTRREGAAWRQLGVPYGFGDWLGDTFIPKPYLGRQAWLKTFLRRPATLAEAVFPWLRPTALWIGYCRGR